MTMRGTVGWLFILVATGVGLSVWAMQARPTTTQTTQAVRQLPPLPSTALSDQAFKELDSRQTYGTLPVGPLPANPARTDPFH